MSTQWRYIPWEVDRQVKKVWLQHSFREDAVAKELGLSHQVLDNFLGRRAVNREDLVLFCDFLGLDVENIVQACPIDAGSTNQVASTELDRLVQDVRQKVYDNIQKRCGEMQLLNTAHPVDLTTIYTYTSVLPEISRQQQLDIAELWERCKLDEFYHFSFTRIHTERKSGLAAIKESNQVVLLGKPGSGKTTFLKRLAILCNAGIFQEHRLPIFMTLKDFGDYSPKPNLLLYIRQWLRELGVQETQSVEQILSQGRGFLLLDGVNEVGEKMSQQVLEEIQSFSDRFPLNRFVVSCRTAVQAGTFPQFATVEVADFNDQQIMSFATRWFAAKQLANQTSRFLQELERYARIKELATNPQLLTLLCQQFEGQMSLPDNHLELYQEGLHVLLGEQNDAHRTEQQPVDRKLSLKGEENLLSQLAFTTFTAGNYLFNQKDAEGLIQDYLQNLPDNQTDSEALRPESETILKFIESEHGLLVKRAQGIYSFSHVAFHEYFTARYLENRVDLYPSLLSHLTDIRWRGIFLSVVGMLEAADPLVMAMKAQTDQLLAEDEKLQQFLTWVSQKSQSVNDSYRLTALRFFYFGFEVPIARNRGPHINRNRNRVLNRNLNDLPDRVLATSIDNAISLDLSLNRNWKAVHCALTDLERDPNLNVADHMIDLNPELYLYNVPDPTLEQALQELKAQFPADQDDWDLCLQWWRTNGLAWAAQLRTVMINYRNIGHDWQFSQAQEIQLDQYCNANVLLVDCLNPAFSISPSVREEIEASLFLPISEIKQNLPNQAQR